jgi:hypothetical protein
MGKEALLLLKIKMAGFTSEVKPAILSSGSGYAL